MNDDYLELREIEDGRYEDENEVEYVRRREMIIQSMWFGLLFGVLFAMVAVYGYILVTL